MAKDKHNIFVRIGAEYYTFTTAEKKLADHILSVQDATAHMSISELAKACGVADATVSRFCRHLGYKSFPDFKLAIVNAASHRLLDNPLSGEVNGTDSLEAIAQKLLSANTAAMTQTLEVLQLDEVKTAAEILSTAKRVLCMGQGGSMLIASEAAHLFSTISNKFWPVSDSHLQAMSAAMMDADDAILFFSYSGSTRDMLDTMQMVREQGGRIILLTRFPNSPGAALADVVLQCGANENPLQSGSVPARIAQMFILDILFSEYSRKDLEQVKENRNRIAQALAEKHI